MLYFEANPRDNFNGRVARTCNTCCAEFVEAIPGETNKVVISYGDWLNGIRASRGLFDAVFSWVKLTPDPAAPFPSMLPPTNTDYQFQIEANMSFSNTVSTNASSPQSSPLTFMLDPVNPPTTGTVAMNSNGSFIYMPQAGFTGVDQFGFFTTDGVNAPVENIVQVGVDVVIASHFEGSLPPGVINPNAPEASAQVYETPLPPSQGLIFVPPNMVKLMGFSLEFALTVSPECLVGQVYRLTVAVQALECDRQTFRHISSYDIRISSCGLP